MNWFKASQKIIIMTPSEKQWAEWAIDPMLEYWSTEEGAFERGEETIYQENDIPKIIGNNLSISNIQEINEDLLYRLEEQAVAVCRTDSNSIRQERSRARAALSLAKKIRGI